MSKPKSAWRGPKGAPGGQKPPHEAQRRRRGAVVALLAIFAAYAAALLYAHNRVPPALNNDVAEEALRGLYLVEGPHFEVLTFAVGHSAETLYLYLVGGMAKLFGPTMLSIQVVSWLFALACIWLVWKLVERIEAVPAWIPALVAACSIWLFHYACCGLRAISAPVFLALFAVLLDRAESRADRISGLACGAALGLSIYAYSSARVLPIAFAVYAAFRVVRRWDDRTMLLRRYFSIAAGAFLVSIPNLLFLLLRPKDFFSRGSYVFDWGNSADRVTNLAWSIFFPLYYPDFYRHSRTVHFDFDAICGGLTLAGFNPVHIIFAVAMLIGLSQLKRWIDKPIVALLIAVWIVSILTLGFAGPSLTRLMILMPVYLVFAALGFGFVVNRQPRLKIPVLILILWVGVSDGYKYLSGAGQSSLEYSFYFNPAATAIGKMAQGLAAQGQRVICVVSRDANVVRYLTHNESARVKPVEFYQRPLDPAEIPFAGFRPNALLIENNAEFRSFAARFPAEWQGGRDENLYYVRLPAQ